MKRKLVVTLLAIVSVLACAFGISACAVKPSDNGGNGGTTCNHSYEYISFDKNNHSCICSKCGDTYNQSHSFNSKNVCSKCGEIKDTGSGTGDDNPSTQNFKTVSLNPNGGKLNKSEEIQTQDFEVGKLMTGLPTPMRDGYTFVCWEEYPFGDEYTAASLMPNHTLQLRAKWDKNVGKYSDEYISLKPASEGCKDNSLQVLYHKDVNKFVYVELTSDDLGGVENVGKYNNFNLRMIEGMEYRLNQGYSWMWFEGDFNTINGSQRFTLNYGSNIQFVTVNDTYGGTVQTYLLDIYVKHDYYISLYSNIFESEPYDKIRVIENERFSAETKTKEEKGFEFDKRVYYNQKTLKYEDFVYSTAITQDWKLYQTYKPVTIEAELNEGTLEKSIVITPYTQYFTLPSAEKEGYDFLGWQLENGNYLTNIEGFAGRKYIASKTNIDKPEIIAIPKKLIAVYAEKKYYYSLKNDTLKTVKTIPVVTYTNDLMTDILEIIYTPYNMDCVLPKKIAQSGDLLFTGWGNYAFNSSTGEYNHTLSPYFDFENKVTKPLALIPEFNISYYSEILPLNEERTCTRTTTYEMYFPASKSYNLTISTTGSVTFKLTTSTGNSTNVKTVTVSSSTPQTLNVYNYYYNLGNQVITGGRATLEVTSLRGSFTANLVGDTTNTVGSPVVTNDSNTAKIGEEFTVPLTKAGYAFAGWYEGNKKVSDTEFISMEDREMTLTAKWVSCPVTLEKSIAEAGSVGGIPATTVIGEEVTITATTKTGYTWVGWYEGETKLTDELSYTFNMPVENTTYTAKWIKITIDKNLSAAGTISSLASTYKFGDEVTITATTNSGYTWVGWYNGAEELTKNLSYIFNMPEKSATYTAKWAKLTLARSNSSAGSVTTLSSKYTAGQEITITATTYSGYTWVGWYNGAEELTKNLSYTFNMPEESATYTAKWAKLTLARSNSSAGSVAVTTPSSTFTAGQEVTIAATTNSGYTWVGWYNGTEELTKNLSYTFNMPSEDVTYTAKWTYYTLSTSVNDSKAGTVTTKSSVKTTVGEEVTITATTNSGYTFVGWYNGAEELTKNLSYTFNMPAKNITYTAKWVKLTLSRNNTSGGTVSTLNEKYVAGEEVTITATTYSGYTFTGWYEGETKLTDGLSYTFNMPSVNATYTAKWIKCSVKLEKNLTNAGTITDIPNTTVIGQEITATATTNSGYTWLGWYNGTEELTKELSYTFNIPDKSVTYTAKWARLTLSRNSSSAGTVSTLNEKYVAGEEVTITATTNNGYTWLGWYNGTEELTKELSYTFNMPSENATYTAKWAKVTLSRSSTLGGTVSTLNGKYVAGEEVTITATTNSGYTWLGWYNGTEELTKELSYTFNLPSEDVTYTAKWISCQVALVKNITEAGTITDIPETTIVGEELTITAETNIGYTWLGWYNGTEELTKELSYTFNIPDKRTTYTAKWQVNDDVSMFNFVSTPTTLQITSVKDNYITTIVVPDYVTSISAGAFSGCSRVSKITLPFIGDALDGSINYFGYIFGATSSSQNSAKVPSTLKNVIFTGGTTIDDDAFRGCSKLTSITIPDNVSNISTKAFYNCSELENITIGENNANYASQNGIIYNKVKTEMVFVPDSLKGAVVIPEGITSIGYGAFSGRGALTSVTLPNGLISIDISAFENCYSLTGIIIPNSVTEIAGYAFRGCSKLQFNNYSYGQYLGNGTNNYFALIQVTNENITSCNIHADTKVVCGSAFSSCSNLKNVKYMGDIVGWCSISNVGGLMGYGSYNNRKLYINNEELTGDLVIPDGVAKIEPYVFYNCSGLTSISIPASVASIGSTAFWGCSGLTSINVDENNANYASQDGILYNKDKTEFVYIPSVKGAVVIPEGITSIGPFAFQTSKELTSITIPESVTSIDIYAFTYCDALSEIYYTGDIASWCGISGLDNLTSSSRALYINGIEITGDLIIPNGVTSISDGAFSGCSKLTSLTIPDSVTTIGWSAFYGCSGLENIYYMGDLASWCGISGLDNLMQYGASDKKLFINGEEIAFELHIPDGVTRIGDGAFRGCSRVTIVVIPTSLTSIGKNAFLNCSLANIYYDGDISSWCGISGLSNLMSGSRLLYINNQELTGNLVIPEGVTSISDGAFRGCSKLTSVTISDGVTSIGKYAFQYCSNLTSITIPDSVTNIEDIVFYNCRNLTNITFKGTKAQWNAITKSTNWDTSMGNYTIHCDDGNITKS